MINGPHGSPAKLVSNANGFPQAIPENVVAVVARAIHAAWGLICQDASTHLAPVSPGNPEEDRYTDALCEILLHWLKSPAPEAAGFTSEVFETVVRSENLTNYDQSVINKQPDLVIRMASSPLHQARRHVGVYIEAKVVTSKRPISGYGDSGIARFVRGDYAWAMQDGLMIAYQKQPGRTIASLASHLAANAALLAQAEGSSHLITSGMPPQICGKSTHGRTWHYVGGDEPGQIRLWHIWTLQLPI